MLSNTFSFTYSLTIAGIFGKRAVISQKRDCTYQCSDCNKVDLKAHDSMTVLALGIYYVFVLLLITVSLFINITKEMVLKYLKDALNVYRGSYRTQCMNF